MPKFASKHLRPKARLLTRMIINTIIPRLGSHEQIIELEHKALYALFSGTMVNWAKFIFDELKHFWTRSWPSIIYPTFIMRLLRAHYPSYLSTFKEISPKYASKKFFSLMHLPKNLMEFISFDEWTQHRQARQAGPSSQPHHEPSQDVEQHRETTPLPTMRF